MSAVNSCVTRCRHRQPIRIEHRFNDFECLNTLVTILNMAKNVKRATAVGKLRVTRADTNNQSKSNYEFCDIKRITHSRMTLNNAIRT